MILAIDIGNTNIVIGCIDKGKEFLLKDYQRYTQKQSWNMPSTLKMF